MAGLFLIVQCPQGSPVLHHTSDLLCMLVGGVGGTLGIHSSIHRYLGYFYLFGCCNNTAMDLVYQYHSEPLISVLWCIPLEAELLSPW